MIRRRRLPAGAELDSLLSLGARRCRREWPIPVEEAGA